MNLSRLISPIIITFTALLCLLIMSECSNGDTKTVICQKSMEYFYTSDSILSKISTFEIDGSDSQLIHISKFEHLESANGDSILRRSELSYSDDTIHTLSIHDKVFNGSSKLVCEVFIGADGDTIKKERHWYFDRAHMIRTTRLDNTTQIVELDSFFTSNLNVRDTLITVIEHYQIDGFTWALIDLHKSVRYQGVELTERLESATGDIKLFKKTKVDNKNFPIETKVYYAGDLDHIVKYSSEGCVSCLKKSNDSKSIDVYYQTDSKCRILKTTWCYAN